MYACCYDYGTRKSCTDVLSGSQPNRADESPQVCSGETGHVEVLWVELNDPETNFEPLVRFFFQFHDPTTKDRQVRTRAATTQTHAYPFFSHQLSLFLTTSQGNDVGTQYASVIFCEDEKQTKIANSVKEEVQRLVDAGKIKYAGKTVHTAIVGANPFYAAHEEHQAYLEKNPLGYCNHFYRFKDWPVLN